MISIPLTYYALTGLFNFITATFLTFFILFKNPKASVNRATSFFFFSVAWWSLFYFIWLITPEEKLAAFFMRTCMIGVLFMPVSFLHFTFLIMRFGGKKRFIIYNYLISIAFSFCIYTPLYADGVSKHLVFPYWLIPGPIFHLTLTHFAVIAGYAFYRMYKVLKASRGLFKYQLLYVFIGTAIGFFGGATNYFSWYRIPHIPPVLNEITGSGTES